MAKGTVKWYDETKGFGFIVPDGEKKDVFFHKSNVESAPGSIVDGTQVEFEVIEGKKGKEAVQVRASDE